MLKTIPGFGDLLLSQEIRHIEPNRADSAIIVLFFKVDLVEFLISFIVG
jgi:hypothetical protein